MDYKKVLDECKVRAEAYRVAGAVWNLTHEEECAATIKDLLARVEAAERERDNLREAIKPNCLMCESIHPDNGNCTEVGGFCTAVPAAHCPLIPKLIERVKTAEEKSEKYKFIMESAIHDINEILQLDELCPIQCQWCAWENKCDGMKTPKWKGVIED